MKKLFIAILVVICTSSTLFSQPTFTPCEVKLSELGFKKLTVPCDYSQKKDEYNNLIYIKEFKTETHYYGFFSAKVASYAYQNLDDLITGLDDLANQIKQIKKLDILSSRYTASYTSQGILISKEYKCKHPNGDKYRNNLSILLTHKNAVLYEMEYPDEEYTQFLSFGQAMKKTLNQVIIEETFVEDNFLKLKFKLPFIAKYSSDFIINLNPAFSCSKSELKDLDGLFHWNIIIKDEKILFLQSEEKWINFIKEQQSKNGFKFQNQGYVTDSNQQISQHTVYEFIKNDNSEKKFIHKLMLNKQNGSSNYLSVELTLKMNNKFEQEILKLCQDLIQSFELLN